MKYVPIILAALGATAGCSLDSTFKCASNESCRGAGPNGLCEPEGWCSYDDPECPMGRRYSSLAGDGLGGVCVGEGLDTDTTGGTTTTSSSDSSASSTSSTSTSTSTSTTTTGPDENVPFGPWWNCDWSARVPVEVTGLEDISGTFEDVVVLVSLGPGRIDLAAVAEAGADLRFVADDHQTELPFEFEVWDPAGVSEVWVRVPMLSAGTRFFIYYDGPATPPSSDPSQTWSSYGAVWHFGGGGEDSTANGNLAAGNVGFSDGRIGQGLVTYDFDPAAEFTVPGNGTIDNVFTAGGMVSAWVRISDGTLLTEQVVVEKSLSSNGSEGWLLELGAAGDTVQFQRGFTSGRRRTDGGSIERANWTHLTLLYDDTAGQNAVGQIVIDGVEVDVSTQNVGNFSGTAVDDSSSPVGIGRGLRGVIDELRIREGGSLDEAIVDYRSQSDQLLGYGPEDRSGCFVNPPD